MASPAGASDRTLKASVKTWSHRIALDARGIGVSASRRHPRRMALRARRFRVESLRAYRAIAHQRPSTARGRRARALALGAFRNYAAVGRQWTLSGQARVRGRRASATRHARLATQIARKGNRLLVAAGRLLR